MENSELLAQVLAAMQEQTEAMERMVRREVQAAETRINLKIENEVTGRIDALFDGYKLVHEKQWELEHQVSDLERRFSRLETRVL